MNKFYHKSLSKSSHFFVTELQKIVETIDRYRTHPWLYRKNNCLYSDRLCLDLKTKFANYVDIFEKIAAIKNKTELEFPNCNLDAIRECVAKLSTWKEEIGSITDEFVSVVNWDAIQDNIQKQFVKDICIKTKVLRKSSSAFSLVKAETRIDLVRVLLEYFQLPRGIFDWFTSNYWRNRALAKKILTEPTNEISEVCQGHIEYVSAYAEINIEMKKLNFVEICGKSNPTELIECIELFISNFNVASNVGILVRSIYQSSKPPKFKKASELRDWFDNVLAVAKSSEVLFEHEKLLREIENDVSKFFIKNPFHSIEYSSKLSVFNAIIDKASDLTVLDKIDILIKSIEDRLSISGLKEVIVNRFEISNDSWATIVIDNVILDWCDAIRQSSEAIRSFDSKMYQENVSKFNRLLTSQEESAPDAVICSANTHKPTRSQVFNQPAFKLIEKQSGAKRPKSPREVMEKGALDLMMGIKSCWLMSPLSISQTLPNRMGLFDAVIFDEASQVRVEDALPAIFRAKTMVVVGDDKQMPPTNFFGTSQIDDGEEDDDEELGESILDLAAKVYPAEMLEWHYRSRAEALITFSNRAFYEGRLIAAPNPRVLTEGSPIKFHKVNGADFSQKNGNQKEACLIVDELSKIIIANPQASLGVITLGVSQQVALEEAIDQRCESDDKFKEAYDQCSNLTQNGAFTGLFIKNLENVQGDERDIIFISVGYAPSGITGKLNKNFGPLSKKGGGRRLNVAVTRAREKVVVFCSFDPSELSIDETALNKNYDSTVFARYLNFAKAISDQNEKAAEAILGLFPMGGRLPNRKSSRFSLDVCSELRKLGYKVDVEIGTCGFYIDLGIEHPLLPRTYAVGIECDGAVFHSTEYARDRDRIRENLLKSRGWKILRVWSQDWSKDRKGQIGRLDSEIKRILGITQSDVA